MIRTKIVDGTNTDVTVAAVADQPIRRAVGRVKFVPIVTEAANHDDGTAHKVGKPRQPATQANKKFGVIKHVRPLTVAYRLQQLSFRLHHLFLSDACLGVIVDGDGL